ncbi:MAG: phenylacetate--CoA ligase family protein [Alphaproteobacteria bacterium]|jgi:phenylacetate-CoA ligase|nr:phenylacetate--CoA ligase family protein [Alphaproteobacteria bacterium]MBT4084548.1 phenylacetate--CoA ligase family protein [Alphaproteobacteria bacterium]MBT4545418.1 phenylacetate--CoA ligase family protein [Alphaproteobacteria bacterium]MBT7748146.1 phenylacetate--CoA ligase family protein [Alphaproteobacteria bacterium]
MNKGTTDPAWLERLKREPRSDKGHRILKLLRQCEQTQWHDPEDILATQFKQLSRLLGHAQSTIPHYAATTSHIKSGDVRSLAAGRWLDVPVLKRQTVNRLGKELLSRNIPQDHGSLNAIYTSGTTGLPVRVERTKHTLDYWSAFTTRDHIWHNRDIDGVLAAIRSSEKKFALYPKGARHAAWGSKDGVFKTGPSLSLNVGTSIADMAEWIGRNKPDYVLAMPNIIKRLAPWCMEHGVTFDGLKEVSVIGEMCGELLRDLCQEAWQVPLHDVYSSREVGYIALQCPVNNHYHVQAEGLYLEILDADDQPCKPGESGRVIVTTIQNYAMPLIRYEVGDYAEAGETCDCGRGLPVIKRILGREQDILVLPGGQHSWTLLGSPDVRDFMNMAPISQYQFAHVAADKIEVRLIVKRELTDDEENNIANWVNKKFGYPFDISFSYPQELALTKAGKFKDFIVEFRN